MLQAFDFKIHCLEKRLGELSKQMGELTVALAGTMLSQTSICEDAPLEEVTETDLDTQQADWVNPELQDFSNLNTFLLLMTRRIKENGFAINKMRTISNEQGKVIENIRKDIILAKTCSSNKTFYSHNKNMSILGCQPCATSSNDMSPYPRDLATCMAVPGPDMFGASACNPLQMQPFLRPSPSNYGRLSNGPCATSIYQGMELNRICLRVEEAEKALISQDEMLRSLRVQEEQLNRSESEIRRRQMWVRLKRLVMRQQKRRLGEAIGKMQSLLRDIRPGSRGLGKTVVLTSANTTGAS